MAKQRQYLLRDAFLATRQALIEEGLYFVDGTDSLYCPKLNTKYLDKTSCDDWPDLDGVVSLMTPGEIARMELSRAFPGACLRARKSDFRLLDISPPMYFMGQQYHGELYYIDLVGAYASIYRWLSLDIAWPRGQGEMALMPVAERLWHHKTARNSVIGISRSHQLTAIKGGKSFSVHFNNKFFNPGLWHTVQAVLHGLASYALGYGCIYVSTDCYMFKRERHARRMSDLLSAFHFDTHTYSGDGHIWGWGSYSLPGRAKREHITKSRLFNIIDERKTVQWLRHYIN